MGICRSCVRLPFTNLAISDSCFPMCREAQIIAAAMAIPILSPFPFRPSVPRPRYASPEHPTSLPR